MSKISKKINLNQKKGLFVDGGSNLGQGYDFFRKYFPEQCFDVVFIEPNPNCMNYVKEKFKNITNVEFIQKAILVKNEKLNFFGLDEDERGEASSGASVIQNHNSSIYDADVEESIVVDPISFSDFLKEKSEMYDVIIVKMDIESAEYEVLKDLLSEGSIMFINYLFVEFHSNYFKEEEKKFYEKLESQLIKNIKDRGVSLTIWV